MARGINKVILVGFTTKDPEVRYSANGSAVANLNIATSEQWKDKQTGQKQEKTEFHRVIIFGKLAEIAGEYLKKGQQVYIEGKLQTRKWRDRNGQDRYTTEIVANEMQMLGSGRTTSNGSSGNNQSAGQYSSYTPPQQSSGHPAQAGGFDDFDDDIPDDFDDDIPF